MERDDLPTNDKPTPEPGLPPLRLLRFASDDVRGGLLPWLVAGALTAAVVILLTWGGCAGRTAATCSPGAAECTAAGVARLCSSSRRWVDVVDCGKVRGGPPAGWRCSCYKPTSTLEGHNPGRCTCTPSR